MLNTDEIVGFPEPPHRKGPSHHGPAISSAGFDLVDELRRVEAGRDCANCGNWPRRVVDFSSDPSSPSDFCITRCSGGHPMMRREAPVA